MSIEDGEGPKHRDSQRVDPYVSAYEAYSADATAFCRAEQAFIATNNGFFSSLYDSTFDGVGALTPPLTDLFSIQGALFVHNVVRNALGERFQPLDATLATSYLHILQSLPSYNQFLNERKMDLISEDPELYALVKRISMESPIPGAFWDGVVVAYDLLRVQLGEHVDQPSTSYGAPRQRASDE
jgi:hypothetical protein